MPRSRAAVRTAILEVCASPPQVPRARHRGFVSCCKRAAPSAVAQNTVKMLSVVSAEGKGLVGTTVWDASTALLTFMDYVSATGRGGVLSPKWLRRCSVCELGCGKGLAGMGFALRGASVDFTDKPDVLEHTQKAVDANLGGRGLDVSLVPFMWGSDPNEQSLRAPYDVIVATDPIYRLEQIEPFVHAARSLCSASSILVVACGMPRGLTRVWEGFLARVAEVFEVHEVSERRLGRALLEAQYSGFWAPVNYHRSPSSRGARDRRCTWRYDHNGGLRV